MKIFIQYDFIFDPESTWTSKDAFDNDLRAFFASKGFKYDRIIKKATEHYHEIIVILEKIPNQNSDLTTSPIPKKILQDVFK